jgi:C-terminal processing protease CtpA/Prc
LYLDTSGLGSQNFHVRVVIHVNEYTTGAAEMLAQLAQENRLGTIVGNRTPCRLLARILSKKVAFST